MQSSHKATTIPQNYNTNALVVVSEQRAVISSEFINDVNKRTLTQPDRTALDRMLSDLKSQELTEARKGFTILSQIKNPDYKKQALGELLVLLKKEFDLIASADAMAEASSANILDDAKLMTEGLAQLEGNLNEIVQMYAEATTRLADLLVRHQFAGHIAGLKRETLDLFATQQSKLKDLMERVSGSAKRVVQFWARYGFEASKRLQSDYNVVEDSALRFVNLLGGLSALYNGQNATSQLSEAVKGITHFYTDPQFDTLFDLFSSFYKSKTDKAALSKLIILADRTDNKDLAFLSAILLANVVEESEDPDLRTWALEGLLNTFLYVKTSNPIEASSPAKDDAVSFLSTNNSQLPPQNHDYIRQALESLQSRFSGTVVDTTIDTALREHRKTQVPPTFFSASTSPAALTTWSQALAPRLGLTPALVDRDLHNTGNIRLLGDALSINEAGVEELITFLSHHPGVTTLDLSHTTFTDSALTHLAKKLPRTNVATLRLTTSIDDACSKAFADTLVAKPKLQLHLGNALSAYNVAFEIKKAGKTEQAIELSTYNIDGLREDQKIHLLYLVRGQCYEKLKIYKLAIQDLEKAFILENRKNYQASVDLVAAYQGTGNYEKALEFAEIGIQLAPSNPDAFFNLAQTLFYAVGECQNRTRAIELMETAITLVPKEDSATREEFQAEVEEMKRSA